MLVNAMYAPSTPYPLLIQPASIDSLEPTYTCSDASTLYSNYSVGSTSPAWLSHLTASAPLFASLDALSGVSPNSTPFHMSYDHYYDNLSSRQCHSKPLPCQIGNSQNCVSQSTADAVYRLGIYEYSYIYRDAPQSLTYSVARYGVFIAELAQHIRDRITGSSPVIYRHNVAHDGSVSPLLSILQVEVMVWPGMGAEVVFEVYSRKGKYFVRVLWGGKVLRSSNPSLGTMDMVDVDVLLAYFDGLVGRGASKVPGLCGSSDSSS
jgi:2-phosphoxylose phosphatase